MKKFVLGSVLALAAVAASAADVGVSAVRDYALDKNGVRLQVDLPVVPFGLQGSVTHVEDGYTRYGVGKRFGLTNVGPVQLSASVGGVYQDTRFGVNGYGLTAGLGATLPLSKAVSLTAGVERFMGQDRVSAFDGNTVAVGLNVKF